MDRAEAWRGAKCSTTRLSQYLPYMYEGPERYLQLYHLYITNNRRKGERGK